MIKPSKAATRKRSESSKTTRRTRASSSRTISARFPKALLADLASLRPDQTLSATMVEALTEWIRRRRRQYEDEMITQALVSIPKAQVREEMELARLAGRSALKAVEQANG